MNTEREWRTRDGKKAWYASVRYGWRQHLSPSLFAGATFCGNLTEEISSTPLRTPLGLTCLRCIWRATHSGKPQKYPGLGAWPLVVKYYCYHKLFGIPTPRGRKKQAAAWRPAPVIARIRDDEEDDDG